jgi:hypothetical protein
MKDFGNEIILYERQISFKEKKVRVLMKNTILLLVVYAGNKLIAVNAKKN